MTRRRHQLHYHCYMQYHVSTTILFIQLVTGTRFSLYIFIELPLTFVCPGNTNWSTYRLPCSVLENSFTYHVCPNSTKNNYQSQLAKMYAYNRNDRDQPSFVVGQTTIRSSGLARSQRRLGNFLDNPNFSVNRAKVRLNRTKTLKIQSCLNII